MNVTAATTTIATATTTVAATMNVTATTAATTKRGYCSENFTDGDRLGGAGVGIGGIDENQFDVSNECALFDFTVYTLVMGFICLVGLVGNAVAFVVLLSDRTKTSTSFLLQMLALADSLVLVTTVPLYVLPNVYPYTKLMKGYHEIYLTIIPVLWPVYFIPYTCTIFLTVLLSLNRYLAVCRPPIYRSARHICNNVTQAKRCVLVIGAVSILYNIPRFFEYQSRQICDPDDNATTKGVFELSAFGENQLYRIIYANLLYFLLMHGGPLVSLTFLNVQLIAVLQAQSVKREAMGKGGYQRETTLVLVVVVFVFLFSQTPTFIDHILWTVVNKQHRKCGRWLYYYTAIADVIAVINASVNFVIYTVTSRKFRRGLVASCQPALRNNNHLVDIDLVNPVAGLAGGGMMGRAVLVRSMNGVREGMCGLNEAGLAVIGEGASVAVREEKGGGGEADGGWVGGWVAEGRKFGGGSRSKYEAYNNYRHLSGIESLPCVGTIIADNSCYDKSRNGNHCDLSSR